MIQRPGLVTNTITLLIDILDLDSGDTGVVQLLTGQFVLGDLTLAITANGPLSIGQTFVSFAANQPGFTPQVQVTVSYWKTISGIYTGSGTLRFIQSGSATPLATVTAGEWSFTPPST